jgi:nicotinate phosphoribosyltransferase
VSGGIDEEDIRALNPIVDAYGVGTAISNAPVIDFAMDIVEIEGMPRAKRGKWSGGKRVKRCRQCFQDKIAPRNHILDACSCGGRLEDLLIPMCQEGELLRPLPSPQEIREKVLAQLERIDIRKPNYIQRSK